MIKNHSIMDGSLCIHIFVFGPALADMSDNSAALPFAGIYS